MIIYSRTFQEPGVIQTDKQIKQIKQIKWTQCTLFMISNIKCLSKVDTVWNLIFKYTQKKPTSASAMEYLFTTFSSFLSYLGENRDMDRSGLDASISCRSASTLRRPSAFWENKNNLSPKKFHLFFPQMKSYLHFLPCMKRKSKYSREPLVCLAQSAQTNQKRFDATQIWIKALSCSTDTKG